jgi:hypothetical protein
MTLIYEPWKFVELYETELGLELWKFLCLPANIVRAETAVDLKRTSVEALERPLNEKFERQFQNVIVEDRLKGEKKLLRLKQMIGHMVGQIMTSKGYIKDKQGVILPKRKNVSARVLAFTKATRFKRP